MIDSVSIRYTMSSTEAKELIDSMAIKVPASQEMVDSFLNPGNTTVLSLPKFRREDMDKISPALISLQFYQHLDAYFLEIGFKLEALMQGKETVRLFVAEKLNIQYLQERYADMICRLAPVIKQYTICYKYKKKIAAFLPANSQEEWRASSISRLPYLALATVIRVDYTININVPDKDVYLDLLRRSFRERDGMKLFDGFDNHNVAATTRSSKLRRRLVDDSDTAENTSIVMIQGEEYEVEEKIEKTRSPYTIINFYDKALKYRELGCEDEELMAEAANIVRFEVSLNKVHHWTKERLCKTLGVKFPKQCGLLPWLDEDIAEKVLMDTYKRYVGSGTFMNRYYHEKAILKADFGYSSKKAESKFKYELIDISMLISRARSVNSAKKQYIEGTCIGNPSRELQGTAEKFDKLLDAILSIGIMPLRLMTDGATAHMKEYKNPIEKYFKEPELNGYLYIKDNPDSLHTIDDSDMLHLLDFASNTALFALVNDVNKGRIESDVLDDFEPEEEEEIDIDALEPLTDY